MRHLAPLSIAAALALAAPAEAKQTDIALEEGHVEVQLSNGVYIGLTPGVDLTITHAEDGTPTGLEIRRGGAQVMTGFGDLDYFDVRIGGRNVTVRRGSAFLLAAASGAVEATVLSGLGVSIEGVDLGAIAPGDHVTVTPDGAVVVARLSAEGDGLGDGLFAAPPPPPAPPGAPALEGLRDEAGEAVDNLQLLLKKLEGNRERSPLIDDLFFQLSAADPADQDALRKLPEFEKLLGGKDPVGDLKALNELLLAAGGGGIEKLIEEVARLDSDTKSDLESKLPPEDKTLIDATDERSKAALD